MGFGGRQGAFVALLVAAGVAFSLEVSDDLAADVAEEDLMG